MRALIIDSNAKLAIAKVIEYAEGNIVTRRQLLAAMEGMEGPIGDKAGHVCMLRNGYRVAFSIEDQLAGMARHISISIPDSKEDYPNPLAASLILNEFGFSEINLKAEGLMVWIEKDVRALNVVEIIGKED